VAGFSSRDDRAGGFLLVGRARAAQPVFGRVAEVGGPALAHAHPIIPATFPAASLSFPVDGWLQIASVYAMLACPMRSLTIFGSMPASSAIVA
jgi:hypothetical protein